MDDIDTQRFEQIRLNFVNGNRKEAREEIEELGHVGVCAFFLWLIGEEHSNELRALLSHIVAVG